ncbi:MAG: hypothetical protein ACI8S6_005258 [Myxococcota bacterium]|jgi:hypothetical protein
MNHDDDLLARGLALLPNLCPPPLLDEADAAINYDLDHHYDPARQQEYDHLSYCPELRKAPAIEALLTRSGIQPHLDRLFGWRNLRYHDGQIAIRRPHNAPTPEPPSPHIDGIPGPHNGVRGARLSNFTALVGVFLSDTPRDFAGNFTVWPGSHRTLEAHFRDRGRRTLREGMPAVDLGAPEQLMVRRGDVILCHYQLGHAAAVNTSAVERRAVFFRLWLKGLPLRRWHYLTNIWSGWRIPAENDRTSPS